MKRVPTNIASSVRARLLNLHRVRGGTYDFLLRRYAAERLLYRLGKSRHRNEFILKGGVLLAVWGDAAYRPTRDIDFTGYGECAAQIVLGKIREICKLHEADVDGLYFDTDSLTSGPIRDDSEYEGLRIELSARLENAVIPIRIDIGFGNHVTPAPEDVDFPTLLNLPAPRIKAYPMEGVVAEKFHAMVVHGERNSRFKDFYDVHVLAELFPFRGIPLIRAVAGTFNQRETPLSGSPACLTPGFFSDGGRAALWQIYRQRNDLPGASDDFAEVGEKLISFLGPLWRAACSEGAFHAVWPPSGPWAEEV